MFRSQVDVYEDPIMQRYVESVVYELVEFSELQDRRIEVVIVNNPTMNAFAVPGGIIGIHTGLFQFAQTEDQFASVIAHEIAHLSQRHFSRRVEFAKTQQPLALAGLLAGLVLIATTGSDLGLAALTATQAATQDAALRYSRGNEQEADRIGMHVTPAVIEYPNSYEHTRFLNHAFQTPKTAYCTIQQNRVDPVSTSI
jgi:predicted Zn-dependent protease